MPTLLVTPVQRLARIAQAVPGLGPGSRIIDVGSGTGCLIPHFQMQGVQDILAVDLADNMLEQLRKRFGAKTTLGNEAGVNQHQQGQGFQLLTWNVDCISNSTQHAHLRLCHDTLPHCCTHLGLRTWCGDVIDLPNYMGPADAFFFNSVFGNVHSQREALLRAALLLRPGGHIVLSHAMGRAWHCGLRQQDPSMVPHELPVRAALEQLVFDLPLEVVDFVDEPDLYLATLQVCWGQTCKRKDALLNERSRRQSLTKRLQLGKSTTLGRHLLMTTLMAL